MAKLKAKHKELHKSTRINNCLLKLNTLSVGTVVSDISQNNNRFLLKNISLCLKLKEIIYLVGPNGAGKSVLLNTMIGSPEFKVLDGSIFYAGQNITSLTPTERAKLGIFMIFQQPVPIPEIKVEQYLNVLLETQFRYKNLSSDQKQQTILALLKKVHLPRNILNKPLNMDLSGGQQKRLEVVAMLIVHPKLILIDELDSGLDINSEKLLFSIIADYIKQSKAGAIIVSHNFRSLQILKPQKIYEIANKTVQGPYSVDFIKTISTRGFSPKLNKQ